MSINTTTKQWFLNFNQLDRICPLDKVIDECPFNRSDTRISQICQFISISFFLLHVGFIFLSERRLRKIYGSHLILWFTMSAVKDILLISSGLLKYAKSSLPSGETNIMLCKLAAASIHFLILSKICLLLINSIQIFYCTRRGVNCNQLDMIFYEKRRFSDNLLKITSFYADRSLGLLDLTMPREPLNKCINISFQVFSFTLIFFFPVGMIIAIFVMNGLRLNSMDSLYFIYGKFSCGDIGMCLMPMQFFLYLPLLGLFLLIWFTLILTQRCYQLYGMTLQKFDLYSDRIHLINILRFFMSSKIILTETVAWFVAWIANVFCHPALYNLHNMLSTFQAIFLLINFALNRSILEILFSQNDPFKKIRPLYKPIKKGREGIKSLARHLVRKEIEERDQ